jgi:formylmethanofuran dehydrogenase subunit D
MVVFVLTLVAGFTQAADKTHDGLIVSVAEGKLVMSDADGKNEHTHAIGLTAKITLNGKEAKLADLKKGDKVKVTASEDGKVSAVAATRA